GAVPSRGDLRLLAMLADFPDRRLDHDRQYFLDLLDRFVGYYGEVSAGRLRIQPTLASAVATLPSPRATYVQRPEALAEAAAAAFGDAESLGRADALVVFFAGPGRESHVGRRPARPVVELHGDVADTFPVPAARSLRHRGGGGRAVRQLRRPLSRVRPPARPAGAVRARRSAA